MDVPSSMEVLYVVIQIFNDGPSCISYGLIRKSVAGRQVFKRTYSAKYPRFAPLVYKPSSLLVSHFVLRHRPTTLPADRIVLRIRAVHYRGRRSLSHFLSELWLQVPLLSSKMEY
jgi:hypothetical protein